MPQQFAHKHFNVLRHAGAAHGGERWGPDQVGFVSMMQSYGLGLHRDRATRLQQLTHAASCDRRYNVWIRSGLTSAVHGP